MFAETHRLALALVADGTVDGLRIDHPDGLADPAGYLAALRAGGAEHVWVEKILDPGEHLREWPVEGTVGYEFLVDVAALFVDPAGEAALTELWTELSGDPRPFEAWAAEAKREQAATTFAPDVAWLRRAWPEADGVEEAVAALPVYRTYIRGLPAPRGPARAARGGARRVAGLRAARVRRALPADDAAGDGQGRGGHRLLPLRAAARAQRRRRRPRPVRARRRDVPRRQRRARGALPARPARHPDARHQALGRRARADRRAGRAGGRVGRARAALAVAAGQRGAGPDAVEQYTIFQTLVGAWPIDPDRLCGYLVKAMRERKVTSNWLAPDEAHEAAVLAYARGLYSRADFLADFEPFAERVAVLGELHALRQLALKLTVPGVPDVYQGDELVDLSLVDPDNRRPVDWERRRTLLDELRAGAAPESRDARKLWLIRRLLDLRARRPEAFAAGYTPLDAGADAVAFLRGEDVAVAMPLREGGLDLDLLALPAGPWRAAVDAELLPGAEIHVLERG